MLPAGVEPPEASVDVQSLLAELKRANELRREAELRADAAQRALEMKTMALARMSHDIRTPLHGVVGMASLLGTTSLTEEQSEFVDTIQSSSLFLLGLLSDILDHSKMEAGKIDLEVSPVNVMKAVDECAKTLSFEASSKNVEIKTNCHNEASTSDIGYDIIHMGDNLRLKQIVLNYLSNAIKFSSDGGVITIDIHMAPCDDMAEYTSEQFDMITLRVTDCGIGIADPSKLFKPFTQASASTSRQYGGTGLGMSIARVLTELMGGEVGISSEPGKGTSVWSTMRLPRALPCDGVGDHSEPSLGGGFSPISSLRSGGTTMPDDEEKSSSSSPQSLDGDRKYDSSWREHCSILVAEDNVVNQKVLTHMLRRLGYRHIMMTSDGLQAVEEIRRSWSDCSECWYDIVLMDCQMPVMDGPEASVAIRVMEKEAGETGGQAGRGRIPIVALTASALISDKELCLSSGMDDFVTKPIDMSHLDAMISSWAQPAKVAAPGSPYVTVSTG